MIQEIILNAFYVTSIIGIGFLAFYAITVYREFKFKITPRINVYFENPKLLNESDIHNIDLVVKNEGEIAVKNTKLRFCRDDVFFDKEYSELVFKNKLFNIGVNLGPKSEFRLHVIYAGRLKVYKLGKFYCGAEYFREKEDIIKAILSYSTDKKQYEQEVNLTLYHLFYQLTPETFLGKIDSIKKSLVQISNKLDRHTK